MINSDGSGLLQLTTNTANDQYPSISSDGTKIAFHSIVDGDDEIYFINSVREWSTPTQLTINAAQDLSPSIVVMDQR